MLETPGRIEPCFFEEHIPAALADLSVDIQKEAAQMGQGLHPDSAAELADLKEETRPLVLEACAHASRDRGMTTGSDGEAVAERVEIRKN